MLWVSVWIVKFCATCVQGISVGECCATCVVGVLPHVVGVALV